MSDKSTVIASDACPYTSVFYSTMGVALAIGLSCLGSAIGTAKATKGVVAAGVVKVNEAMKNALPVIMAGILGIYGLIIGIIITINTQSYSSGRVPLYVSFSYLSAGLSSGICALAAGIAIGVGGNAAVRAVVRKSRLFVLMLLTLVFSEALALYGFIIGLFLALASPSNELTAVCK